MGWRVAVTKEAAEQIRSLDPSLKAELVEQVDRLSESPAEFLTRPVAKDSSGFYRYSYRSEVVDGLVIALSFDGLDESPPRLALVGLSHFMHGGEEES